MAENLVDGVHSLAQPYFFQGRGTGCLLLHGFTGSPPELLPLGKYLAEQGCAVAAPLLAGHGTRVEDLARTGWRDWLQSAAVGLSRLREEPIERVFLIGLSMGGLLGLMLAAEEENALPVKPQQPQTQAQPQPQPKPRPESDTRPHPQSQMNTGTQLQTHIYQQAKPQARVDLQSQMQEQPQIQIEDRCHCQYRFQSPKAPVAGLVTINSPIFLQNRHARFSSLLRWFITSTPKDHDPAQQAAADALRFSYSEMPVDGVANLMRLVKAVRGRLPRVKLPALIVQSQADDTVLPVSGEYLYKYINSPSKRLLWLKEAPHLVSLSRESEMVWRTIDEFIKEHS